MTKSVLFIVCLRYMLYSVCPNNVISLTITPYMSGEIFDIRHEKTHEIDKIRKKGNNLNVCCLMTSGIITKYYYEIRIKNSTNQRNQSMFDCTNCSNFKDCKHCSNFFLCFPSFILRFRDICRGFLLI